MEKTIYPGVYCITNIVTNIKYIGSTNKIHRRKREHFYDLKIKRHCNRYLQSSFNKHGGDNFIWEILEECHEDKLIEAETFWIHWFGYDNTYNIHSIPGVTTERHYTPEQLAAMSKRNKEVWLDPEYKAQQMQSRKGNYESDEWKNRTKDNPLMGGAGEANGFYGKKHTDEVKAKLSKKRLEIWDNMTEKQKLERMKGMDNRIRIKDTVSGIEYNSITEAANAHGYSKSQLSKMLNGTTSNRSTLIKIK